MYSRIPYSNIDWNSWAIHCSNSKSALFTNTRVVRDCTILLQGRVIEEQGAQRQLEKNNLGFNLCVVITNGHLLICDWLI